MSRSKSVLTLKTLIVGSFLMIGLFAQAKGPSLSDYLQQVQTANPTLRAAEASFEAARYQVRPAATWDDPFIAAGVDEIPFDGGMGSVRRYQISQTIPFPGKTSARKNIANSQAESAKSDVETTSRQIRVLATQIYFKTYLNQKSIEQNQDLLKILRTIADSAKARYQSGTSGHHEWLLSQVELSVLEVEKLKLNREQKALVAAFNELRNEPVQTSIGELDFQFQEPNGPSPEKLNLSEQPEMKSLDLFISQTSEEERLARLSYFPDLVLQGMMMEPSPDMMDEKKNWGVMLGVNLPLFFWRKQSDLVKSAAALRRAAEFERQSLSNRVQSEWLEAHEQLKTSKDVVKLYQNSVLPSTRLAAQNAKTGYSSKKLPLDQYLNVLKVQRSQELELIAAQMDVQLADLRLKDLLSNPPLIRLSPGRPSLFGTGDMSSGGGMDSMGSGTVNMGSGMSGPTRKTKTNGAKSNGNSGMEGM